MATPASGEFEKSLARLEEIVAELDREGIGLDQSVALFREGKALAQRCEHLLKDAQTAIESAASAAPATPETLPF
jgi:exodeoxyribonuclease VII small subunit